MIASIARFEVRKRLRMTSTWVYFSLFNTIAFVLMIASAGFFKGTSVAIGSGGKVFANAPFAVHTMITVIAVFGMTVTASMMGQAVYQDFDTGAYPLFFTSPVRKGQYLTGRFLGTLATLLVIFSGIGLGSWMGTFMPHLEPSMIGPNHLRAYVQPYLVAVLPNLVFTGALFFTLAALTRKILPVYVGSVVLLIGYLVAGDLTSNLDNKLLASLVDPFGLSAIENVTRYWSIAEKNLRVVPLAGHLLYNRALWTAVGAAVLALCALRFRFAHASGSEGARNRAARLPPVAVAAPVRLATPQVSSVPALALLPRFTWLAFRETVKNIYFLVIVLAGVLFVIASSTNMGSLFGTKTYPVTYAILDIVGGGFFLFQLIIIATYAGELVWRERDARVDQISDVLPIPTWLPFLSKLLALMLTQVVLLGVVVLCGMGIQAFHGYFHFEPGLYFRTLFVLRLPVLCMLCVLAMAIQSIVNHKYFGHGLMIAYFVLTLLAGRFGFEHNLYLFARAPRVIYSDMNGFGPFLTPTLWFGLYWAAFSVLLALASNLFWVRGLEQRGRARLALARQRLTPGLTAAALAAFVAMGALGAFIFHNTNVLNQYRTTFQAESLQAAYETKYTALAKAPQPRITDVKVAFEIYPERRELQAKGTYALVNKTQQEIRTVYVNLPIEAKVRSLLIGGFAATSRDEAIGFTTFELAAPLAPGAATTLAFDLAYAPRGFANGQPDTQVAENGTFVNSEALPHLGYAEGAELSDDTTRRKHGLTPKERMADLNDPVARRNTYVSSDADWIRFEGTVGTSADQTAILPGSLVREWKEGGRHYFHYRTTGKILDFYSVLSARYQVRRDAWKGVGLEIFYHPGHEYNLDRMMDSLKASLAYFTTNFSPYQHEQVRIVEFPRYASFAQSFPGTIPYSESIGFIAKVNPKDEEDVDYPYYVTAHEVAHQWWAHQVVGGNVQGSTLLSETLAQYSALMVMKQKYGDARMKRFLSYELNRYLVGRSMERKKELPLIRVENQAYLHYEKGSLVMYALQDYLGEATVNRALASFVRNASHQEPPYAISLDLVAELRKVTPADLQYLIDDMFEHITLYDNRALSASLKRLGKDQYQVKVRVSSRKLRADDQGVEKEMPVSDLVDVGVVDAAGVPLVLEKQRMHGGEQEFSFVVTAKTAPAKAGIDPLNKLIDRTPDDNLIKIAQE